MYYCNLDLVGTACDKDRSDGAECALSAKTQRGTTVKKILPLLFVLLVFAVSRSWAASCPDTANNAGYVFSGASAGGNGASWSTAYQSLPASLTRGCTYYVAAGTYPGHVFADPDSGTTTISILAATASAHGTSTGWNASTMVGQAVFHTASSDGIGDIINFQTDYYTFSGVYRSTSTGVPETDWKLESGYGFKLLNSSQVACEADLEFGGNSQTIPAPVHDITFDDVDISGSNDAASGGGCHENAVESDWGSYNLTMNYNTMHDTGLTIFYLRGETANCSGASGNVTCGSPASGYGTGKNITVEYGYFYNNYSTPAQHAEGCSCSQGLQNLTFAYNYWQDINGTGIWATATAADWNNGNGGNGPWYIYGNVVFESSCSAVTNSGKDAGISAVLYKWDTTFTGAIYFLNNTIYNLPSSCNSGSGVLLDDGSSDPSPATAIYVQNNVWATDESIQINNTCPSNASHVDCTSMTWAYNAYFASGDNSGSNDSDSNKQVSSSSAPFTDASTYDFRLTSDTDAGVNTNSEVAANATDLFGTTRGANGTWDRGALQIAGSSTTSTPPNPPTNLTVTVQ